MCRQGIIGQTVTLADKIKIEFAGFERNKDDPLNSYCIPQNPHPKRRLMSKSFRHRSVYREIQSYSPDDTNAYGRYN